MQEDNGYGPRTLPLEPQGPDRSRPRIELAAQAGGFLVGAVVDGAVRTWLAGSGGRLVLVVWPEGFRARWGPLDEFELLDDHGQVIAQGGEMITVGGGSLVKAGDPRMLGHEAVFITSAWHVTRASTARE